MLQGRQPVRGKGLHSMAARQALQLERQCCAWQLALSATHMHAGYRAGTAAGAGRMGTRL